LTEQRGINYGEIRQIEDDDTKLFYLKKRLECFLVNQVDNIYSNGIYSPFPLTVITCVAVETLGRVISPVSEYEKDSRKKNEISKLVSVPIYGLLDKKLTRPLNKEFKKHMQLHWPPDNIKSISSYAELFHSYLRTSFIHGYRGKNVFLSIELEDGWEVDEGSLIINPNWFWLQYKRVFSECFVKVLDIKEMNNPYRINALNYFNKLVSE
jgi:hypothetical protein